MLSGQVWWHSWSERAGLKNKEETALGNQGVGSLGKVLLYKHEDLSSDPPCPSESQACLCTDLKPQCWEPEAGDSPVGALARQSN